jgi:hypothetical protein
MKNTEERYLAFINLLKDEGASLSDEEICIAKYYFHAGYMLACKDVKVHLSDGGHMLSEHPVENIIKVDGKSFRCDCGANVFHKPLKDNKCLYECNGCGLRIIGE